MKVLHVTDSMSGGVMYAVALVSREQARTGVEVTVAYAPSSESPDPGELARIFGDAVALTSLSIGPRGPLATMRLMWAIMSALKEEKPDVLHLHSTVAGVAGRVVAPFWGGRVYYTPHGFSFIRQDISAWKVSLLKFVEVTLGMIGSTLVAVSESEFEYARKIGIRHVALVQNRIDIASLPVLTQIDPALTRTCRVVMVGRVCAAKAPWRFAAAAREFAERAEFIWFGDGPAGDVKSWLGDSPVRVTGWLAREDLWHQLANSDVVLFTSEWEGLPISLIEAQAMGLPAVASDIPAHREIVISGETGFLFTDVPDMLAHLDELISNPNLLSRMRVASAESTRDRFDVKGLSDEIFTVYRN